MLHFFCAHSARETRTDQTSRLLFILKRRGSRSKPFQRFLESLSDDYSYIAGAIKDHKNKLGHGTIKERTICTHCVFVENLIPEHVTHLLYQNQLITDSNLDTLNNSTVPSARRTQDLLKLLQAHRKPIRAARLFKECLNGKYSYLSMAIGDVDSATNLPVTCECPTQDSSTSDDEVVPWQPDQMCSSLERTLVLHSPIAKQFPTNKSTMKLCKNLWDTLFDLREKGAWTKFGQLTTAAFAKYEHNPDVQVLLHRSEMCIATFYKDDATRANEMYQKANALVPSTSMPTWHQARILPLKVQLHAKAREYATAQALLQDAKQAMSDLSPCLSTGAVHFFEAKYLTSFLKCNRGGVGAESLRSRIKAAYLTAIEHYQQENVFNITSFLNQVYLFLALFALDIDPAEPHQSTRVSREDLSLAEHYLNLFENDCWDVSTCWSKLHFYLGRAELHRQRGNLGRTLDYLHNALDKAKKGDFQLHAEFVRRSIDELTDSRIVQISSTVEEKSVQELLNGLSDSSDS